jgi:hypothetical protein
MKYASSIKWLVIIGLISIIPISCSKRFLEEPTRGATINDL